MATPDTATLPEPSSPNELYRLAREAPADNAGGAGALMAHFGLPYHPGWVPVACYRKRNEDGGDVIVSASRMPAIFYHIDCPAKSIRLGTGSSAEELAHDIATAITEGMLGGRDA